MLVISASVTKRFCSRGATETPIILVSNFIPKEPGYQVLKRKGLLMKLPELSRPTCMKMTSLCVEFMNPRVNRTSWLVSGVIALMEAFKVRSL